MPYGISGFIPVRGSVMFCWLKKWLVDWAERYGNREIERLHAEGLKLRAEILKSTGEERIQLTPEEIQQLNKSRQKIDPEVVKRISIFTEADLTLPADPVQRKTGDCTPG